MLKDADDLIAYILENYEEVTDQRIDDSHWDLMCTHCKIVRGFQIVKRAVTLQSTSYNKNAERDFLAPLTFYFRCPVCKAFKIWVVFSRWLKAEGASDGETHYFRVTSIPGDGLEDIEELPADPRALRTAYRQAIRAMDANAHLAAAAMFRRALQVITRDILGAKPGNLASELKEVVGKSFNGVTIRSSFAEVGYIVKEAGNQGAHPDKDPDLLDFTAQDAEDLQRIFMELVGELFIVPEAARKAKTEFLERRKIQTRDRPA